LIVGFLSIFTIGACSQSKKSAPLESESTNVTSGSEDMSAAQVAEEASRIAKSRNRIAFSDAYKNAAADLLEEFSGDSKKGVRYFSLIHQYNAGASDVDLEIMRQGLAKAINSISRSGSIISPQAIDNFKLIYRIELGDFGWGAKDWDLMVRGYPYLVIPRDETPLGILQNDCDSLVPLVNADWFVANVMTPPLYYQMQDAPSKLAEFESQMGVSFEENIKNKKVIRAAFDNSKVSPENRVIERHPTKNGFLWRSYEFDSSSGVADVLENPLGPTLKGDQGPFGGLAFQHLGTEIVYQRSNGMLGFYVAGLGSQRIDEAPGEDDKDPIPAGAACMACHAKGLVIRDDMDMVRDRVESGEYGGAKSTIKAIYPGNDDLVKQLTEDSKEYLEALKDLGVDTSKKDPVSRTAERHFSRVSTLQASAELDVDEADLQEYIAENASVSSLWKRGSVRRSAFTEIYQELARDLQ
jgi:hypothetical protein